MTYKLSIPFGKTVTYGDIAEKLTKRRGVARMSAQSVGGANRRLTDYGGGIKNKVALLAHEGLDVATFLDV